MSKTTEYIRYVLALPPRLTLGKAIAKAGRLLGEIRTSRRDRHRPTYEGNGIREPLYRYLSGFDPDPLHPSVENLRIAAGYILEHRFDLLGSGRAQVRHGMTCPGLAGYSYPAGPGVATDTDGNWLSERVSAPNLPFSRRIWRLIDDQYVPIDWHLDFKSGYRWSETTWYKRIRYGTTPGVDVKVPWELSRMQHLPQLALSAGLAMNEAPGFASPQAYAREFRNQVLDFVATNPPRFGVNWKFSMDVAIRAANLLVAYDLFQTAKVSFDNNFEEIFCRSIYEHGRHVIRNLEWTKEIALNHYTGNIAGLLFAAAYLPRSSETDSWLAFAVQELQNIVQQQFLADGSHCEDSTAYHCLCTEMVVYATALILGLPPDKLQALREYNHRHHCGRPALKPSPLPMYPSAGGQRHTPFPESYILRLRRMAAFVRDITRPDGTLPQIGDNDSGDFLVLVPDFAGMTVRKAQSRYLNLRHIDDLPETSNYYVPMETDRIRLIGSVKILLNGSKSGPRLENQNFEEQLVAALTAGNILCEETPVDSRTGKSDNVITPVNSRQDDSRKIPSELLKIEDTALWPTESGYILSSFPDFGLYIFRSNQAYFSMRCGYSRSLPTSGHAHNDQLSFELAVNGKPFIIDPGTFVYTPLPEMRNRFRSTPMHNTLWFKGLEQNISISGSTGLFHMTDRSLSTIEQLSNDLFVGKHYGFGDETVRSVKLEQNRIDGTDACRRGEEKIISFHLAPEIEIRSPKNRLPIDLVFKSTRLRVEGGPGTWSVINDLYAPAYGVIVRSKSLRLHSQADQIRWNISWNSA